MKTLSEWQCKSKVRYLKKQTAWQAALRYFKDLGTYTIPYKCRHCKKFHLTSKHPTQQPSPEFANEFNKWFGEVIF